MKRKFWIVILGLMAASSNFQPAMAEAAQALVDEFDIRTYRATREDQDVYELLNGLIIKTRYCYEYAYAEEVVVTRNKMIFIDSDEVCDIDDIYRP